MQTTQTMVAGHAITTDNDPLTGARRASVVCPVGMFQTSTFHGYGADDAEALRSLWSALRGASKACLLLGDIDGSKRAQAICIELCTHI